MELSLDTTSRYHVRSVGVSADADVLGVPGVGGFMLSMSFVYISAMSGN